MGYSNRVIQKAIREQMRGKVPDLNRLKREEKEALRIAKLHCRWDTEKGELCYKAFLYDLNNRELEICNFGNMSRAKAANVNNTIDFYNRTHKIILTRVSRDPRNVGMIKSVQKELSELVLGNER